MLSSLGGLTVRAYPAGFEAATHACNVRDCSALFGFGSAALASAAPGERPARPHALHVRSALVRRPEREAAGREGY